MKRPSITITIIIVFVLFYSGFNVLNFIYSNNEFYEDYIHSKKEHAYNYIKLTSGYAQNGQPDDVIRILQDAMEGDYIDFAAFETQGQFLYLKSKGDFLTKYKPDFEEDSKVDHDDFFYLSTTY